MYYWKNIDDIISTIDCLSTPVKDIGTGSKRSTTTPCSNLVLLET